MNLALLFQVANYSAITGWLFLALAPRWSVTNWLIHRGILPGALSLFYLVLFIMSPSIEGGGFGSLAEVKALFSNDHVLLVGWVHYLAFDMVVGAWCLHDSWQRNIHHLVMLPILFFCFMLGPIGYLAYLVLREFFKTEKVTHERQI